MARPSKVRERVFCRGMVLPMSYRVPDDVYQWLTDRLTVSGDAYHTMLCSPLDVVTCWRWVRCDVKTIQRRRVVSYSYAARILQYVELFDRYLVRWYEDSGGGVPMVDLTDWIEWTPNRYGLNFNRLAMVNKMWREYQADSDDMMCHIDRKKVREIIRRLNIGGV